MNKVSCVLCLHFDIFWQGDPGEDGAPGKPGTLVVRRGTWPIMTQLWLVEAFVDDIVNLC